MPKRGVGPFCRVCAAHRLTHFTQTVRNKRAKEELKLLAFFSFFSLSLFFFDLGCCVSFLGLFLVSPTTHIFFILFDLFHFLICFTF